MNTTTTLAASSAEDSALKTYEQVAASSNEVAGRLAQRLKRETQGDVLFSAADRGRYATDASIYQVTPLGVFVPQHSEEVAMAMAICRDLKVPIVPRGGGTSQCGQTTGVGLVIDHSKHVRNILNLDLKAGTVEVQPGLVLDTLNASLKKYGVWFPVDVSTSAQATLGGMAGNNSCGSRSIAYGNMVHNVLGAKAWLSNGELLDFSYFENSAGRAKQIGEFVKQLSVNHQADLHSNWPKVLRRVAGYNLDIFDNQNVRPYNLDGKVNLSHLLVGSEGTLAMTQSLTLKLSELPTSKVLGVVNFNSFYKAMDSAQHIVKLGNGSLTAVELVDRTMIDLSLKIPAFEATIRTAIIGEPEAILLVEFAGNDKEKLKRELKQLVALMGDMGLHNSVVEMVDDAPQKNLWEVRKAGLNIMMSLKGDGKPVSFIEDCAVPLEHLAEYTDALTQVFQKYDTKGTWYAHASVGTLHVRPILDMRRDGPHKMRAIAEEASALVRKFKGAYSGEHGDGLCRGEWIEWQFGPDINQAFSQIKHELDPLNLLSPNRMVNPPKMDDTSHMRFGNNYKIIPIQTALDWSAWNVHNDAATEQTTLPGTGEDPAKGLAKAVEMCNNNGTCRKFDAGTMCPSFRVTRDEVHATRGRANTLRLALSGQLQGGLESHEVKDAMDLCVGCKGCKRDCPTGVDMARMKIEVQHHYNEKHGLTLKDALISNLPRYAHIASQWPVLMNLRNHSPLLAKLAESLTGLAAERSWPKWKKDHFFNGRHLGVSVKEVLAAIKPVVLFVDTFNGYFESENAWAAYDVLTAAGYQVHIASRTKHDTPGQHLCCGRTYLASGQVSKAKEHLKDLLEALLPFAQKGIAIVGLEPSCLLTLRDESLVMGLGQIAETVASQAVLFEEFLATENKAGQLESLKTKFTPAQKPILLHGHCHQKAFGLMPLVTQVIQLIPQAKVDLIESSCCGMAGSFGYETSHLAVSKQMAEANLLPSIRNKQDACVVTDGTSCRHQIMDGTQRDAIHVALLLSQHLKK
jgi:FAD/FMN-containing dehydrogenase/Fe-S oxidoreductase